jgi:ABC-type multidrug transport system ATPase subunit
MRELAGTTTILVSTHLMEDVNACCDSVVVLDKAHSVFTGTPEELRLAGGYSSVVG